MPRPSQKTERLNEILQAFQRCILRHGLAGSSLELVAKEAGLQRSLIRHFAGNRDELIRSLACSIVDEMDREWHQFIKLLPEQGATSWLLDGLFSSREGANEKQRIISILARESAENRELRTILDDWMKRFIDDIERILEREYPEATHASWSAVAFGICSIYMHLDSMATPLELDDGFRSTASNAAKKLISTLKNNTVLGV